MYLKCMSNSVIRESDSVKVIVIVKNRENPFISNTKNDNFLTIGFPMDATISDYEFPKLKKNAFNKNIKQFKDVFQFNNSTHRSHKDIKDFFNTAPFVKNEKSFTWKNIDREIYKNNLYAIRMSKVFKLDFISYSLIKTDVYNDILNNQSVNNVDFKTYKENIINKTFKSSDINDHVAFYKLVSKYALMNHKGITVPEDSKFNEMIELQFVLEFFENNGVYLDCKFSANEGIETSSFTQKLIDIESKKENKHYLPYKTDIYRIFDWSALKSYLIQSQSNDDVLKIEYSLNKNKNENGIVLISIDDLFNKHIKTFNLFEKENKIFNNNKFAKINLLK